jgi:hypothetical protein
MDNKNVTILLATGYNPLATSREFLPDSNPKRQGEQAYAKSRPGHR